MTPKPERLTTADATDPHVEAAGAIAARIGIDDALIERLLREFYLRASEDPLLGPIFAERVAGWDAHIAMLTDFWSSIILKTNRYRGTARAAHLPLALEPEAFARWLDLFTKTAADICPPQAAAFLAELAGRIAGSLAHEVAAVRGESLSQAQSGKS